VTVTAVIERLQIFMGEERTFCCFNEFDLHILLCVNNETYLILPMKGYTCYIEMNGLCTGTLCD